MIEFSDPLTEDIPQAPKSASKPESSPTLTPPAHFHGNQLEYYERYGSSPYNKLEIIGGILSSPNWLNPSKSEKVSLQLTSTDI
jgi:hypothetical protein